MAHCKYVAAFKVLGTSWIIEDDLLETLEEFVCAIYGGSGTSVNELRYQIYCSKPGEVSCDDLPPCHSALKDHSKRANYQSRIWRLALDATTDVPPPVGNGWEQSSDEDGDLIIKWMSCKSAPDEVRSLF